MIRIVHDCSSWFFELCLAQARVIVISMKANVMFFFI